MQDCSSWRVRATAGIRNNVCRRLFSSASPPWRPAAALDEWVQKEARPISLRQLAFFARTLTEDRLLASANYLRTELPTRLAHRLRDMQTLPYVVVTNPHMSHVYEIYYKAFEAFRKVNPVKTIKDNDQFCAVIGEKLKEHLTVIPRLAMGVLECQDLMVADEMDTFMNTLLRSRISRRVIAEHHLALTEIFKSPRHAHGTTNYSDASADFIGQVFLKCNAGQVLKYCSQTAQGLAKQAYGFGCIVPEIELQGHLEATFPYVISHLEYIIGELLRNSMQAVVERFRGSETPLPAIKILVCESPQHVIFRISDEGGGIPRDILPHLWSFSKGPRRLSRLENLLQVPKLAATMQELDISSLISTNPSGKDSHVLEYAKRSSLSSLTSRPPNLRLGMGLPMSRVYAEYWAGSLEMHNLEGHGVDAFLQISKLGNKNEQLITRASMDAV